MTEVTAEEMGLLIGKYDPSAEATTVDLPYNVKKFLQNNYPGLSFLVKRASPLCSTYSLQ
ncbi:hypothetical protein FC093_06355 [Ilyomonas limi]|uniref:Uncharacterized protein n=1 Tax=Ilyomonas limi TaxID=2575867 RepID=A0A4U3L5E1_9BACT|nr:hypothetical protein [Ilyomonas limi]TKK70365.1 hypothetical protein FC093_06355 [Ilyomonas limi]